MTFSNKMAKLAVCALEDKKAEAIRVIDVSAVSTLADYFIIANGTNRNQVQAMADNVHEMLVHEGFHAKQTEGYTSANWILLDYGDVVVNVFDKDSRNFYDLERIWRDGRIIEFTNS